MEVQTPAGHGSQPMEVAGDLQVRRREDLEDLEEDNLAIACSLTENLVPISTRRLLPFALFPDPVLCCSSQRTLLFTTSSVPYNLTHPTSQGSQRPDRRN